MASIGNMNSIEKLTETNYESWKVQMRNVLICNDLWDYMCERIEKTAENQATWETKDGKALAMILLCVSTNQLNHIKKAESSAAAWKSLENMRVKRTDEESHLV